MKNLGLNIKWLFATFTILFLASGANALSNETSNYSNLALDKNFQVMVDNDTLSSGWYYRNFNYYIYMNNVNDSSHTILSGLRFSARADNITNVGFGEYATWNKTSADWEFPPDQVIQENDGFSTGFDVNYSESKYLSVNMSRWMNQTEFTSTGYQLAMFNVSFENTSFLWVDGHIWIGYGGVNASIVPGTFITDAPVRNLNERENNILIQFDKENIKAGVTYNFSVIIKVESPNERTTVFFKPDFSIVEWYSNNHIQGGTGFTEEIPSSMLPEHVSYISASTNIFNSWQDISVRDALIGTLHFVARTTTNPTPTPTPTPTPSVGGWIQNPANGHYYKLTTFMNWSQTEAQAVNWGGHLVTINDADENAWLVSTFGSSETYWIGYTDKDEEGNWRWISGEASTYSNWFQHPAGDWEPNDAGQGEDAATINYNDINHNEYGPGKWNDIPIDASGRGIVESPMPQLVITPTPSANSIGYSATVSTGQNTFIVASSGNFGTILPGQRKIINESVTLNNTGDVSATVDARLSDNVGGVYGLVSGSNVLGGSNFSLAITNTGSWTSLNDAGSDARVATSPGFGALTILDARLFVPQAQPGGAYSGTVILTFGN